MQSFPLFLAAFAFLVFPFLFFLVRYPGGYSKRTVVIVRVLAGLWLVCVLVLIWLDSIGGKTVLVTEMYKMRRWGGGLIFAAVAAFVPESVLDRLEKKK